MIITQHHYLWSGLRVGLRVPLLRFTPGQHFLSYITSFFHKTVNKQANLAIS